MVWKQDLAKLKQEFKEGEGVPPPPPPKPKPKPLDLKPLDDEDALFLSAMGVKRSAAPKIQPGAPVPAPPIAAPAAEAPVGFADALKDLKGLKPMGANPILARPAPATAPAPKVAELAAQAPSIAPTAPPPTPSPAAASAPVPVMNQVAGPVPVATPSPKVTASPSMAPAAAPARIQLAAGMSVEVDGSLDLRHHSVADAEERLKDRLADAAMLSWRTLHLLLGSDPALHEAVQSLLDRGALPVARYAQAPVPLGGAQAWILYLIHFEA